MVLGVLLMPTTARAADPVFQATPAPGWTVNNGVVYAITTIGNTTVVGGTFTQVRNPATGQVVTRNRIAAFDRLSGALLPTFAGGANNGIRALENDGTRVFAAGDFTTIGGVARTRVAALDGSTGATIGAFNANANATVRALEYDSGTLYLGGVFSRMNGAARPKLAAVDAANGALRTGFASNADRTVFSLARIPGTSTLAVGGNFTTLGGTTRRFLGSVSTTSGAVTGWTPPQDCSTCFVLGLDARSDLVYGAVAGPGGRASAWGTTTGTRRWSQHGDGDVQAVRLVGDTLYAGGHYAPQFGAAGGAQLQRSNIAAMDAATGQVLPWAPLLGGTSFGVWAIDGDADALWVGGGFTRVQGQAGHERITHFLVQSGGTPSQTLVEADATWRYHDSGPTDLGTAWRDPAYDDAAWPQGAAQLGFGDGDESTTLTPGRITYYFRHRFEVSDPGQVQSLVLDLVRDDGIVVYLNGVEVARDNLPAGTVTATTQAPVAIAGTDESTWQTRTLSPGLLNPGTNVVAVEVHQSSLGSSDVSFAARLNAS
ncbi:hypothetical protein [Nocardioides sp. GXQ0305]|uniref:hypothetical protein n=1 Tax=Nocardioides sp. GXQ0305 TaxID=3423912 RepID=UPI003D7DE7C4